LSLEAALFSQLTLFDSFARSGHDRVDSIVRERFEKEAGTIKDKRNRGIMEYQATKVREIPVSR